MSSVSTPRVPQIPGCHNFLDPSTNKVSFSDDNLDITDDDCSDHGSETDCSEAALPPAFERIGNVRRINVKPIEEAWPSSGNGPFQCKHGKRKATCTLCTRPRGRYGREYKEKQDMMDLQREEKRRRRVRFE